MTIFEALKRRIRHEASDLAYLLHFPMQHRDGNPWSPFIRFCSPSCSFCKRSLEGRMVAFFLFNYFVCGAEHFIFCSVSVSYSSWNPCNCLHLFHHWFKVTNSLLSSLHSYRLEKGPTYWWRSENSVRYGQKQWVQNVWHSRGFFPHGFEAFFFFCDLWVFKPEQSTKQIIFLLSLNAWWCLSVLDATLTQVNKYSQFTICILSQILSRRLLLWNSWLNFRTSSLFFPSSAFCNILQFRRKLVLSFVQFILGLIKKLLKYEFIFTLTKKQCYCYQIRYYYGP